MELEEAKQKLEEFIGIFYEFPNPTSVSIRDYEVTAIETVLQALDNSIPKEKVENKIEYLKHKDFIKLQVCYKHDNEALKQVDILEELLGERK